MLQHRVLYISLSESMRMEVQKGFFQDVAILRDSQVYNISTFFSSWLCRFIEVRMVGINYRLFFRELLFFCLRFSSSRWDVVLLVLLLFWGCIDLWDTIFCRIVESRLRMILFGVRLFLVIRLWGWRWEGLGWCRCWHLFVI